VRRRPFDDGPSLVDEAVAQGAHGDEVLRVRGASLGPPTDVVRLQRQRRRTGGAAVPVAREHLGAERRRRGDVLMRPARGRVARQRLGGGRVDGGRTVFRPHRRGVAVGATIDGHVAERRRSLRRGVRRRRSGKHRVGHHFQEFRLADGSAALLAELAARLFELLVGDRIEPRFDRQLHGGQPMRVGARGATGLRRQDFAFERLPIERQRRFEPLDLDRRTDDPQDQPHARPPQEALAEGRVDLRQVEQRASRGEHLVRRTAAHLKALHGVLHGRGVPEELMDAARVHVGQIERRFTIPDIRAAVGDAQPPIKLIGRQSERHRDDDRRFGGAVRGLRAFRRRGARGLGIVCLSEVHRGVSESRDQEIRPKRTASKMTTQ
jgi:hypothetical protein